MLIYFQGKFLEVSFDFKGDPTGAHITNCKYHKKEFFHKSFTDLSFDFYRFAGKVSNNPPSNEGANLSYFLSASGRRRHSVAQ